MIISVSMPVKLFLKLDSVKVDSAERVKLVKFLKSEEGVFILPDIKTFLKWEKYKQNDTILGTNR